MPDVTIPVLTGIVDMTGLQQAITFLLLDDPQIAAGGAPVVPELKLQMTSDQTVDALWTLPRSAFTMTPTGLLVNGDATGPVGAGLLVEMPGAVADSPGVSGSPLTWDVKVACFEERNTNMTPGVGTLVTAEQYAQLVLNALHLQYIFPYGVLQVQHDAMPVAHDWMSMKPGIFAQYACFKATVGRVQSKRTAPATVTISGGQCTLACADGTAAIWYSTDGSAPVAANAASQNAAGVGAQPYTGPFAVASGVTVLAAARSGLPNTVLSAVNGVQAP